MRIITALCLAGFSALLTASPAKVSALIGETATVTPSTVAPGATFNISGTGWTCGVDLTVNIGGSGGTNSTITAAQISAGTFDLPFTAPSAAGAYDVTVSYALECTASAVAKLTVEAPVVTTTTAAPTTTVAATTTAAPTTVAATTTVAADSGANALPATGSDHTESILLAALLAGSGYALVRATRRKGSTLSD